MTSSSQQPEQTKPEQPRPAAQPEALRTRLPSEALILFLTVVFAYLLVALYEWGNCRYYRVPIDLFAIDMRSLSSITIVVATIVAVCIVLIASIVMIIRESGSIVYTAIEVLSPRLLPAMMGTCLLVVAVSTFASGPPAFWQTLWTTEIPYLIFLYCLAAWFHLLILPAYMEKIAARLGSAVSQAESSSEISSPSKSVTVRPVRTVCLVYTLLGVLLVSIMLGFWRGRTNTYLTPAAKPNLIVLRIQGDRVICAPYDRANNLIRRSFFIFDLREIGELRMEKTGPLRIESLRETMPSPSLDPNA